MVIIGLHNDEDSGACLMKDGVLLGAVSEERLNRIKLYKGLPVKSLEYFIKKYNLNLDQIDYFAYGWHGRKHNCREYAEKLSKRIIYALKNDAHCADIIKDRITVEKEIDNETLGKFQEWMMELGIPEEKIYYLDHHKSHAWSAFSTSPFESAFVFTFDGRGDLKSATVSVGTKEDGLQECDYLLTFDSLGYLYGKITNYLGFRPHRHEGKVTGLAAYGNSDKTIELFRKLVRWENGSIISNLGFYKPFFSVSNELRKELDRYSREDIAAGVQKHCEEIVAKFIKYWIKKINKPEINNVCLAGGLFANVKINQKISEIEDIDNVYIFPHMGDGGLPVGSACYLNYMLSGQAKIAMPTIYLGPEYSNGEVLEALKRFSNEVVFQPVTNKVDEIVSDLIKERVVGYFDTRMEYGPRALGARSILYHARDKKVNDWLNERLKRTEFMPFAPVTTIEHGQECYINWNKEDVCSYFMTITYDCTESFKRKHKGVVHVDGTARPQIVKEELNGDYYRIVKNYCEKTGERALINTSFNQHEEPIVCSPNDAIESLIIDNVDILYIGDYKVVRKQ